MYKENGQMSKVASMKKLYFPPKTIEFFITVHFNIVVANVIGKEKDAALKTGNKEIKFSLFTDYIFIYIEKQIESTTV